MHDLLLSYQDDLQPEDIARYADQLGLDTQRFQNRLRDNSDTARIAEDIDSADLSGVSGTPTLFINGRRLQGAYDIAALSAAVANARDRATLTP